MVDVETGLLPNDNTKKIIYESFKQRKDYIIGLEKSLNKDRLKLRELKFEKIISRFY